MLITKTTVVHIWMKFAHW